MNNKRRAQKTATSSVRQDAVERLASYVAKRLRAALGHPTTANAPACGYGTVCMTGHPILESLWIQCTENRPESVLISAQRDISSMPLTKIYNSGSVIHKLPLVPHRDQKASICLMTEMWALDELRAHAQWETSDSPRTPLDTVLSKLNHGNMIVIIRLYDFVDLLKHVLRAIPAAPQDK